ncbi:hypothetical protein B0H11DRAFT_2083263 [Mycena galericulata]|nr:hypothetical protein B0H11DRAFT_2083263 [Mycena galericulata]
MAYAGPTFFADNAKALEIKETANVHFRNKEYQKAVDLYSSIINQYDDRVMLATISVVRCNRAACYLNLGEYQRCIDDCYISLLFQTSTPGLADKARFRLQQATKALDEIDEQKRAVDPPQAPPRVLHTNLRGGLLCSKLNYLRGMPLKEARWLLLLIRLTLAPSASSRGARGGR